MHAKCKITSAVTCCMEGCTLQEVVGAVPYSRDSSHLLAAAVSRREKVSVYTARQPPPRGGDCLKKGGQGQDGSVYMYILRVCILSVDTDCDA